MSAVTLRRTQDFAIFQKNNDVVFAASSEAQLLLVFVSCIFREIATQTGLRGY